MLFYIMLLLAILLIFLITFKMPKKFVIALVAILLIIIMGFREDVGTDFSMYKYIFYNIDNLTGYAQNIEIGYIILNKAIRLFTDNHRFLFLSVTILTIYLIMKSIDEMSINYRLSIILFITLGYFHSSFNLIRQYIALAIFLSGIKYILKRDFLKYLIRVIIASLFHKTILILLPLYFVVYRRYTRNQYLCLIGALLLIGISNEFIFYTVFPKISPYYFEKYGSTKFLTSGLDGFHNTIFVIGFIIICMSAFMLYNQLLTIDEKFIVYFNFCILSLPFMLLGLKSLIFFRCSLYLSIFFIFLIPLIIKGFNKKSRLIIFLILFIFLMYFFIITIIYRDGVIPYRFYR